MIKSTEKSAVIRKNEELEKDIIKIIKDNQNPQSTTDISFALHKAWHTIDRACLKLQIKGTIEGFKVGKMNLWRLK